jgi:hypothetical protein
MLNDIFEHIYNLSLLNLYSYTDCRTFKYIVKPSDFNDTIHKINYDDIYSDAARTDDEKHKGYPLWKQRLTNSLHKIDHVFLDCILSPYYVIFSSKDNNLFVTFRGTGNFNEAFLDVKLLIKSYIMRELTFSKIDEIISDMYEDIKKIIIKYLHPNKRNRRRALQNVIFTGHSLGALLACVYLVKALANKEHYLFNMHKKKKYFLVLFGMPCFGDEKFRDFAELHLGGSYINIYNNNDVVMRGSGMFNYHLNNVIKFQSVSTPQETNVILGDNRLLESDSFHILLSFLSGPIVTLVDLIVSIAPHMMTKYAEAVYYFLQNKSDNKIIEFPNIVHNFTQIFNMMSKRFRLDKKPIEIPLLQYSGRKVSRKKNLKKNYRKSRRSLI